jgi:hypothetical protein
MAACLLGPVYRTDLLTAGGLRRTSGAQDTVVELRIRIVLLDTGLDRGENSYCGLVGYDTVQSGTGVDIPGKTVLCTGGGSVFCQFVYR